MILTRTVAVLAAVLALSGCGAEPANNATPSPSETTATPTPSPTPTPAAPTTTAELQGTTQQYAGLINTEIKGLRKSWGDYRDLDCTATTMRGMCAITQGSIDMQAGTIVAKLTGAQKPGVPAYIGAPPAEMEKLVAETAVAAQQVDVAIGDDWNTYNRGLWSLMQQLMGLFDRWDPYL